ncbi:MAG: hypothetical protein JXA49_06065 [Actinobacteria bacterium]|nr:hypothetical protein [Actinomycetota bacterium]
MINKKNWGAVLLIAALAGTIFAGGCGLQIEEANDALSKASAHQQEAEEILLRLKAFPQEWETLFSSGAAGPDQIAQARQVVQARGADVEALEETLKAWGREIKTILTLNVDQKVKDYVELKLQAINCWESYTAGNLRPIISLYGEIVELLAYDRPSAEQEAAVQELAGLVKQSSEALKECEERSKKADDFFEDNKLGK